jgi:hypothetical protein
MKLVGDKTNQTSATNEWEMKNAGIVAWVCGVMQPA